MNILIVCMGNICRSPLAEAILKHKYVAHGIDGNVESAGFESYHINEPPDERALITARKHGLDISEKRARLFSTEDFDRFDKIFVMDSKNFRDVMYFARHDEDRDKVEFIMNRLRPGRYEEVPDPYYSKMEACDQVFNLLDQACEAIVTDIKAGKL